MARVREIRREFRAGEEILVKVECSVVKRLHEVSDILLR